jgi:serine/threonine protein kinase
MSCGDFSHRSDSLSLQDHRETRRGGKGVVYKVLDTKLDRLVALKFLLQQITVSAEDKTPLLQEGKAISTLNHPNIAAVLDIDEVEDQKHLGMEYMAGGTLKSNSSILSRRTENI